MCSYRTVLFIVVHYIGNCQKKAMLGLQGLCSVNIKKYWGTIDYWTNRASLSFGLCTFLITSNHTKVNILKMGQYMSGCPLEWLSKSRIRNSIEPHRVQYIIRHIYYTTMQKLCKFEALSRQENQCKCHKGSQSIEGVIFWRHFFAKSICKYRF